MRRGVAIRQSGKAAPTNFLFFVMFFIAVACGWVNGFLMSRLWPLIVTIVVVVLSYQYVMGWIDELRKQRRPNANAKSTRESPSPRRS